MMLETEISNFRLFSLLGNNMKADHKALLHFSSTMAIKEKSSVENIWMTERNSIQYGKKKFNINVFKS